MSIRLSHPNPPPNSGVKDPGGLCTIQNGVPLPPINLGYQLFELFPAQIPDSLDGLLGVEHPTLSPALESRYGPGEKTKQCNDRSEGSSCRSKWVAAKDINRQRRNDEFQEHIGHCSHSDTYPPWNTSEDLEEIHSYGPLCLIPI